MPQRQGTTLAFYRYPGYHPTAPSTLHPRSHPRPGTRPARCSPPSPHTRPSPKPPHTLYLRAHPRPHHDPIHAPHARPTRAPKQLARCSDMRRTGPIYTKLRHETDTAHFNILNLLWKPRSTKKQKRAIEPTPQGPSKHVL